MKLDGNEKESSIKESSALGDERGYLTVIEGQNSIPFDIKRVFYIYGTLPDIRRGFHAHYKTRQALISVSGSCKVYLDNTKRKTDVVLDSPTKILILEPNDWHEMYDFSPDCVLLVLASHLYDSADYIRDYDKFIEVYGG
ncbi:MULTISPECIES: FdtA/QdtA family cupin domain-containing protein [Paenibacillus]|uniref:sugar 3,4-ketoisomerase n=1 Tax=Paenibacillus TaxID=44249 RepID=UPI00096DAE68|nr:FdtA/QdtA family cupin domain-containing protein [Paenibacillus odorifer]OMD81304.1 dTDP-6-deoxy-3,4-keto-hexulose isomerase [Paenibacillus odorifer]OMD83079.1 dTDP-6-deoxy-3,4-keto-hexulose isomerase [Paenibacillus odorifer]OME02328.1 dTDP-6-deoxy-3,4-keto-hexulose isomerase [Paenibacillus odorifer]OME47753.1 dTDP-6-deoxy-3,4-keto-hexulose isomerase [Paenibacillus odorifer]